MIQEFVDRFMAKQDELKDLLALEYCGSYTKLVTLVLNLIVGEDEYGEPDPEKITVIDHGGYQGTMLFIIPENSYQPSNFWYVKVSYGSCSCCDTLQSINNYSSDAPTEQQVKDYMTLALHIVQNIKKME